MDNDEESARAASRAANWRNFMANSRMSRQGGLQAATESSSNSGLKTSDDSPQPPDPPYGALVKVVRTSEMSTIVRREDDELGITNSECIASYNWVEGGQPTILIPGSPPVWAPSVVPRKLNRDEGGYFRDLNAARFSKHPMEPAVRAIFAQHENFFPQKIDIVACSSTLGSLLRFARGYGKPFRFFVEIVGNTAFLVRREKSPTQLIEGVQGYGHTFPQAYTSWDVDVQGSVSHQRVLKYSFGELNFLVRFGCDGYLKGKVKMGVHAIAPRSPLDVESASALDRAMTSSSKDTAVSLDKGLDIEEAGVLIPQEAVFDLKTRSVHRQGNVIREELPRFWVTQMPHLILARHTYGVFNDIKIYDTRNHVTVWELRNQEALTRLDYVIRKIISTAKQYPSGKLEVVYKESGKLELREQDSNEHHALPPDLRSRWMETDPSFDDHSKEPKQSRFRKAYVEDVVDESEEKPLDSLDFDLIDLND